MRILIAAALVLAAGAAQARDMLPLKHGFYVTKGTPCANASNATISRYAGTLAHPPGAACEPPAVTHKGGVYTVRTACGGEADTATYTIESPTAYTMRNFAGSFSYRLCPQGELPEPWRSVPTR